MWTRLQYIIRSRPRLKALALLAFTASILAFVNDAFDIRDRLMPGPPEVYRLRVTVLDRSGSPTTESRVTSSWGGEPKTVQGGWEFTIARAAVPTSGAIEIFAERPGAFERASTAVVLANDPNVNVVLLLKRDTSATISGTIVDANNKAIPGAVVTVVGHPKESARTLTNGGFTLLAHAATGEQVQLQVEMTGYGGHIDYYQAGYKHVIRLSPASKP